MSMWRAVLGLRGAAAADGAARLQDLPVVGAAQARALRQGWEHLEGSREWMLDEGDGFYFSTVC